MVIFYFSSCINDQEIGSRGNGKIAIVHMQFSISMEISFS